MPQPLPELTVQSRMRRIIGHPLVLLTIGVVLVVAAVIVSGVLLNFLPRGVNSPVAAGEGLVVAVVAVIVYKAYKRWIEREPDAEFAAAGALGELAAGLAFGAVLFSLAVAAVAALGGFEVLGVRGAGRISPLLGLAIYSGPVEEIVFRGLGLRLLERLVGTWLALAATSALFGFAHLMNPGATVFSGLAITLEAGIMLGAAFLLTRRLWLAIGIHSAWNFTQGWVFSIPVSGSPPPIGLLVTRRIGPDWLTGGAFGLEASAVTMLVATIAGLGLLWQVKARGDIVPPRWRRPAAASPDPI